MALPETPLSYFDRPLSRRQALRDGALLAGGLMLSSAALTRLTGQPATGVPSNSVDSPEHPIAKMRQGLAAAPLETIRISDRHFALLGHGGNIGLYVGDASLLVVDSGAGLAPATQRLRDAIRAVSDKPLRYVVNTHWHFDHTDGNANLHGLGATIVAHRAVRERLSSPQTIAFFNARFGVSPKESLPELTFNEEMNLHVGGDAVRLRHVAPAHTDSDALAHWVEANVIQTGDLYFSGAFPFIDTSSGGSLAGMIRATELILGLANDKTTIIPGHGPISGRKELAASLEMLRTVQERIDRLKSEGKSVDQIVAAKPLADLDERWGKGMINADTFVRIVTAVG